ncbi:DUF4349 domain-containing protein [Aeromicrobium sp. UC242_57]|uniref:DUF4349 domain-containing protein n=1 Tax=Aeromicrobium sp. UC242_57 TaxID=3374624 RepID=UPI0037BD2A78
MSKDLDARIDALQISVDRLQSILAEADTSREVISAEGALTERQEQLESLQSQKRSLAGQVELSSISVDFAQKTRVDTVEPGGFTGGLRDGWNALVSTVNHVVELIGVLLPLGSHRRTDPAAGRAGPPPQALELNRGVAA